ncbi:MAG: TldD/PmbA family protein [Candidatus Zixiibacteriota bacterium]
MTRFATNYIHQNVVERTASVQVRVVLGRRIGHASTNRLDAEGLQRMADDAFEIARHSAESSDFGGLPSPQPVQVVQAFRPSTERFPARRRAEAVAAVIAQAKAHGLTASGAFETGLREFGIANSKGVFLYNPATVADFNTVIMSDDSAGYASQSSIDVHDLDVEALGKEAIDKADRSRHPIDLEPGDYPVVLEPYAVSTLVEFLGYLGFNGQAYREGRSFMVEKMGQQVVHPSVNIWDDALDPRGLAQAFDFEGMPKQRVDLIVNGVAKAVVWDAHNARLAGVPCTGHGLPAPNGYGAIPLHTHMAAGETARDELTKGIKRGLWVTRLHYVNPVHPKKTLLTGMTRDGTFLIEEGKVTRGVKNLRFTNSILDALSAVEALSRERRMFIGQWGSTCVPAARLSRFTFSGKTDF